MEKIDINLIIEDVNNSILEILSNSNLPIGILHLIIKNINYKIEQQYYSTLNSLIIKLQKEEGAINNIVNLTRNLTLEQEEELSLED